MMSRVPLLNDVMSVAISAVLSDVAMARTVLSFVPKFIVVPFYFQVPLASMPMLYKVDVLDEFASGL